MNPKNKWVNITIGKNEKVLTWYLVENPWAISNTSPNRSNQKDNKTKNNECENEIKRFNKDSAQVQKSKKKYAWFCW